MWGVITLGVSFIISWIGYGAARRFVRERLRYVDAAMKPAAPVIAGFLALLVALPLVSLVHWIPVLGWVVGGGTALVFGVSVTRRPFWRAGRPARLCDRARYVRWCHEAELAGRKATAGAKTG